jgi:hypothetical protein
MLLVWSCQAAGETYLGYDDHGGTWIDTNKTWDDDSNMCWAAAASNILKWGKWEVASYNSASLIFNHFKYYWANTGGEVPWAYDWWFSGRYYTGVAIAGGGNFWPSRKSWDLFHAGAGDQMQLIDRYLRAGYGVTLGVQHVSSGIRHAMTVWGFDYHPGYDVSDERYYSHLYVTDPDDNLVELRRYEVGKRESGFWYFNDEAFSGYRITVAEGLERRWVPEFPPDFAAIDDHSNLNELFLLEPFLSFDYRWEPPFPVPQPGDPCLLKVLVENEGQWQTLFQTAWSPNEMDWQSINIPIPKDLRGLQKLSFLLEGTGNVSLYRLAPVPLPGSIWLLGGALVILVGLMSWKKINYLSKSLRSPRKFCDIGKNS